MWQRSGSFRLRELQSQFPAVLLLGARQVGKTTLARNAFPEAEYCDLEEPGLRQLFLSEPTFQIEKRTARPLILDEAQAVPPLFSALRGVIDRDRSRNGRFFLLGSANPALVRGISESLAGRVGILELDPLTVLEVSSGSPRLGIPDLWLKGGFPDSLRGDFRNWWESYLRTYIERDLPHLELSPNPLLLRRLITMIAHQQGGMWNASRIAASLGVSYQTVSRYLDILEQTFLVRVLRPFFKNLGKRLVKSPKVYLRDTGLLHHVLNIATLAELEGHPSLGSSWETFVLEDVLRREKMRHPHGRQHFWRTATGIEADLLLERGKETIAIEIKTGEGDLPRTVSRMKAVLEDTGANRGCVITQRPGIEPLAPRLERRGFESCVDWLP